jgi:hypothetical protein
MPYTPLDMDPNAPPGEWLARPENPTEDVSTNPAEKPADEAGHDKVVVPSETITAVK